ncbi:DNA polymerase alpha catalytic subunit isoform X1 [Rosa chinensis]|nr:DNA polymerase alpha catalytic subunit isoform X1 [Rosa chinensis]
MSMRGHAERYGVPSPPKRLIATGSSSVNRAFLYIAACVFGCNKFDEIVTAISLKTIINEKQNVNKIVSASIVCCNKAKIDTPVKDSEWKSPGMLSHFTVVRKLDGGIFPMGFTKVAADKNSKAGSNVLSIEGRLFLDAYFGTCMLKLACLTLF